MIELWEKTILPFLTDEAFKIAKFSILWWYVIVAAAALVVVLIVVTIIVACSKKKKKKANDENKQNSPKRKRKNSNQDKPFEEIAPDWQPVAIAQPKDNEEQNQAVEPEEQTEPVQEEQIAEPEEAEEAEKTEAVEDEPIVEEQVAEEPVEEPTPSQPQVAEPVAQEEQIEEDVQPEVAMEEIVEEVEEEVAEVAEVAETVVAPKEPISPAEYLKPVNENTVIKKKENLHAAERVKPVNNNFKIYQPKPIVQPVKKAVVQQEPVQQEPVQQVAEMQEPAKQAVVQKQEFVRQPVQQPVAQPSVVEENKAKEAEPRYQTPIVKPQRVVPTVVEDDDTNSQEVVATTAPRALPKKAKKGTKMTADQIATEIQAKTGANPRKKADNPAVVGKDKLPKKSAKTKKADAVQEKAPETTQNELPIITTDPTVETFGKFVIIKNDDNSSRPYHFRLLANNGQILFESESYKSKPKSNSITAFKKAATIDNFEIDVDKAGNWRYKLYNNAHTVIGVGESYSTKQGCENSVQSVIKFAESARYLEDQTE